MVEFDTLYRLGNQPIETETLEVLFEEKWYTIISVYASAAGGRMWIRAGMELATFSFRSEEMTAVDPSGRIYNIGINDNKIQGFRGPDDLFLYSDEEIESWGLQKGVDYRADPFPPCAESRLMVRGAPTLGGVDNSGDNEDAGEEEIDEDAEEEDAEGGISFSLGGSDDDDDEDEDE